MQFFLNNLIKTKETLQSFKDIELLKKPYLSKIMRGLNDPLPCKDRGNKRIFCYFKSRMKQIPSHNSVSIGMRYQNYTSP